MKRLLVLLAFGLLLPAPAPAQIAYRDHTSAGAASTAGASITHISPGGFVATAAGFSCAQTIAPTTPGGVVGDLLIALAVSKDTAATTLQASAGWNTLFADDNPGGFSYQARIYWRFADGTASDNLTVSRVNPAAAGCDVLLGRMSRFRGVDPVDPFQTGSPVPAANWTFSNSAAVTTGTETTTAPNSMLIFAALIGDNDGTGRPAGFTAESFDSGTGNGTDGQVSLKYGLQATAGLEGPFSVAKGGVDPNHGVLIALRPAEGLRINLPALTAAGDVMVASIAVRPSTIVVSAPPGWTQVRDMPQVAGTTSRMATYYRTAATPIANEPASHNFTFSGGAATGAAGGIISFSGVDTTTPIDAEDGNTTPSALTHTVTPGITTTVADTMLVGSFEFTSTPDAANWTSNLTTDRVNQGSIASPSDLGMRLLMAHEARAAIGATGTRTATASGVGADTGLAFLLALRPGVNINHFSISHAGSGVACVDQTITITAHDAAHSPVSANSLAVALSTTNSRGTWTGIVAGGGVLSDPTPGDGAATYTFAAASSSVQLSFRYANLAATSETFGFNVSSGGFSETTGTATAADDPSFTMAQAGFQFRNVTDGNTTIPTQISGRPSDTPVVGKTISIQAIRTDTATGACVALFGSQTRTVDLGAECNNPATCAAQLVSVNGTNIATSNDNGGAGAAAYTGVSLTFNASSEAATVIAYPDAGQMSLHARFDLDPGVAGFEMTGASNPFVVRPFGLRVSGVTTSASPAPSDLVFAKAGADFNVTVTAVRWKTGDDGDGDGVPDTDAQIAGNAATPNFGQETPAATATLSHTLNAPAGGSAGTLGGATTFTGFSAGSKMQAVNWSEVGFINLIAQSPNYLGAGQTARNSAAGLTGVGRFYPDHFALTPGTLTNRQALACASTFTYEGEQLRATFMLTARNGLATPTTTTNYDTTLGFARLDGTMPANFSFGAVDLADVTPPVGATALTPRLTLGTSSGTWAAGTGSFTADLAVSRAASPDGPFESFQLGVIPTDADGVTLRAADLNLDTDVPANGNDRILVGSSKIRFGRLRINNASGSQLLQLPVLLETQYWNGTAFITNTNDSCTAIAAANIEMSSFTQNLNACETSLTAGAFASGRATALLSAPGSANNGSVILTPRLEASVPPGPTTCIAGASTPVTGADRAYLQGRWDAVDQGGDGLLFDDNPAARATFGVLKGSEEVIFIRENF